MPGDCVVFIYHQSIPNQWHFFNCMVPAKRLCLPSFSVWRRTAFVMHRCRSETTGVTCVLVGGKANGKGFFISRDTVKRVG